MTSKVEPLYNGRLEDALRLTFPPKTSYDKAYSFPGKYGGTASLMHDPKFFRAAICDWIRVIRKRVIELTNYDPRLRERTLSALSELETEIKKFPKEENGPIIMAIFVSIISRLLGYDWNGIINREVIFFQNAGHELIDLNNMGERIARDELKFRVDVREKKIKELIDKLSSDGLKTWQIAEIMGMSNSQVTKIHNSNFYKK